MTFSFHRTRPLGPSLLLGLTLALSACGTTGGSANGWAAARRSPPPPRTAEARPAPERPAPARPLPARPLPPSEASATASGLVMPVVGFSAERLRDSFHAPRSGGRTHHAIDLAAPTGTPLVAVEDGTVTRIHWNALGGNTLYLRSADGRFDYYYAHLHTYAPGLAAGQRVRAGDVLGTVGATGNAQGPHLHFQVLDLRGGGRGVPVNPFDLLRPPAYADRAGAADAPERGTGR